MIGLDTNVLVRYIVQDDPAQAAAARLIEVIDRLMTEPTAGSVLKGEFAGLRRLRVGDYRVVYEVIGRELVVLVIRVGLRGTVNLP